MPMNIIVFSNVPAPYFVAYLNELGKKANVTAVFEQESFSHRDMSWKKYDATNFKIEFLNGVKLSKIRSIDFSVIKYIKKYRDDVIIITNPLTYIGMMCIEYCNLHKIPYAIQSEGGLPKSGKGIKEKIKMHFLKNAELYLSGMSGQNDYFLAYGAKKERVKHYPFASLSQKDFLPDLPSEKQKKAYRKELGMLDNKVVLYVGRMLDLKGVDVLIKSMKGFNDNIDLYLVGGEEPEDYKRLSEELGLKNIKYIPHVPLAILRKYYISADVFVLPTRGDTWGLVINEAMSYGLPIITTDVCVAGLELVENGINGYIVGNENVEEMHERIEFLLNNPEECKLMAERNYNKMLDYSYENMAGVIYDAIVEWKGKSNEVVKRFG